MVLEIRLLIKGEVVGVGFRVWVKSLAMPLALAGFARNVSADSVEVILQGEKSRLKTAVDKIIHHAGFVRIENVDVTWRQAEQLFEGFEIR